MGLSDTVDQTAYPGYTLITPLMDTHTYLLDMDGEVVHTWDHDLRPGLSAYLLEDGSLLRCARDPAGDLRGTGAGGRIQRIGWDGELLWDYHLLDEVAHQHHDIEPLPGGNVLAIVWEAKSAEQAIEGGRDVSTAEAAGEFWAGAVFEIRPVPPTGGEIVWEWHAWDHRVQDRYPDQEGYGRLSEAPGRIDVNGDLALDERQDDAELEMLEAQMRALGYAGEDEDEEPLPDRRRDGSDRRRTRRDWLHLNAVSYCPESDLILLSSRTLSEVWILDHSTTTAEAAGSEGGNFGRGGELLFRWGNPSAYGAGDGMDQVLFGQHDPRWIDGGTAFTVFNNGLGREPRYSSVEEVSLPLDRKGALDFRSRSPHRPLEVRWSFGAAPAQPFYARFISGAERLPNGNTLVCDGPAGRVFEVTEDGEEVWAFVNELPKREHLPPVQEDAREVAEDGADSIAARRRPGSQERMPRRRPRYGPGRRRPSPLFRATRIPLDHPGLPESLRRVAR